MTDKRLQTIHDRLVEIIDLVSDCMEAVPYMPTADTMPPPAIEPAIEPAPPSDDDLRSLASKVLSETAERQARVRKPRSTPADGFDQVVFDAIAADPEPIPTSLVCHRTGSDKGLVMAAIKRLVASGRIFQHGRKRGTTWGLLATHEVAADESDAAVADVF